MQEYFLRQCLTHTSTSRLTAAVIIATIITAIMVMMIMMIFFLRLHLFIHFWLQRVFVTALGHSLAAVSRGCSLPSMLRTLIAMASLVAEQTLEHWLGACGTTGMWDLPGPGIEPVSPALAGRFLITRPPGKSMFFVLLLLLL